MILLAVLAFLLIPSIADARRDHLSEALRLKCNALPYRTTFVDDRCYVAVLREIEFSKTQAECSSILAGAKVSTDLPSSLLNALMVEKTKFHTGSASSGSKQFICVYDNGYKCDANETMLSNGRCVVRAPKKMNFADARKYCEGLGMELPAPANDLDNRVIRNALAKNPAWVDKSFTTENGFKWKQGMSYSRWSTCNYTAGHQPRLYSGSQNKLWQCNKDKGTVVDSNGYWSNGGTEYLMDVVCLKNAENPFTKGGSPCNYHETNAEQFTPITGAACGTVNSPICYTPTRTTTRYEVFGKATVETQRGCEVLCNNKQQCIAFSFKDDGFSSSCILHSSISTEVCSVSTTKFVKKTAGCVARTNISADFGEDPCIDELLPSAFRGLNQWTICNKEKGSNDPRTWRIVRAIDLCGRRITLDNEAANWIEKAGDMFRFRYKQVVPNHPNHGFPWLKPVYEAAVDIVAASCATAGGEKCPCAPLQRQTPRDGSHTYPATTDRVNPCKTESVRFWYNAAKCPDLVHITHSANMLITCQAGMWMTTVDPVTYNNYWGLTAAACT